MNDRARDSRRTGILRLRHLQEVTEAKAEEMAEAAPRFARLADKAASAPRVVVAFQLFQTPEPLAARLVELATEGGPACAAPAPCDPNRRT